MPKVWIGLLLAAAVGISWTIRPADLVSRVSPKFVTETDTSSVYDVLDLFLQAPTLNGRRVTVSGRVTCQTELFCFLENPVPLSDLVVLNLGGLTADDRRQFIVRCSQQTCRAALSGYYFPYDLDVLSIRFLSKDSGANVLSVANR